MNFFVVGKRVVIADRGGEQPGATGARPKQREYQTRTAISCPPRSMTGLGSELMAKTPGMGALMELETTSSGGLLRALSGSLVWRTAGDFSKLAMDAARTRFADGRMLWEVVPSLTIPVDGPITQVIKAQGELRKLTNHMLTDIRDYVKRLVEAAERNELPLCLLRHLLSFLGSPPGGATCPHSAPRHPPVAVWRTMTRLRALRLDSGHGGHAHKRHHTSEWAGTPGPSVVHPPPRRRHLTAPGDLKGALSGILSGCDELSPLPSDADHPLNQHMADRTVRFCARPGAAVWEGSEFSLRWRRELANQQRYNIVGRVTLFTHTRHHLKRETSRRCQMWDAKRLLWKRAQQQRKLLRQHQQQEQTPERQKETLQPLPHPYPHGSRVLKLLGISSQPFTLGNNMLVFPPLPKGKKRSASAQRRQPELKFEPSQKSSLRQEKSSQGMQDGQLHLQEQQAKPQRHDSTTTVLVHYADMAENLRSPSASAPKPSQQSIEHQLSSPQQVVVSTCLQQPRRSQHSDRQAVSIVPDPSIDYRLSLEDYRFALLADHLKVLLQGRRPRQKVEKPLPPRSPLAGPAPPKEPPHPQAPPASSNQQKSVIRPGLWMRVMGPLPPYTQEAPPSSPHIKGKRLFPPQIQSTWPSLLQTQRAEFSAPQTQRRCSSSPQLQVTEPSPLRVQGTQPCSPQAQRRQVPPSQTQGARFSPLLSRQQPTARSPATPSPSFWDRMTDRLGLAPPVELVELGQEATEARVRAIVEYQSRLPPLWRVRLLDGGC